MAGKVVDFNPAKRISKEEFEAFQAAIAAMTYEDTQGLTVIQTNSDGDTALLTYGLDFHTIGIAQATLTALGQHLLADDMFIGRAGDS